MHSGQTHTYTRSSCKGMQIETRPEEEAHGKLESDGRHEEAGSEPKKLHEKPGERRLPGCRPLLQPGFALGGLTAHCLPFSRSGCDASSAERRLYARSLAGCGISAAPIPRTHETCGVLLSCSTRIVSRRLFQTLTTFAPFFFLTSRRERTAIEGSQYEIALLGACCRDKLSFLCCYRPLDTAFLGECQA